MKVIMYKAAESIGQEDFVQTKADFIKCFPQFKVFFSIARLLFTTSFSLHPQQQTLWSDMVDVKWISCGLNLHLTQ